MTYLEFEDFDQLYHKVSRLPVDMWDNLKDNKDFFTVGASAYLNNVMFSVKSHKCSLDMGNFNYTIAKWTTLINKYIDPDQYILLKQRLIESTTKTLTFNFKIHIGLSSDNDHTKNRDSCIIAMVFSRNGTKGKWTTVNVIWRTAEIYKKWAIDLILLNRMFEDLPNLDLHEYILYLAQPFWSSFILCELIDSPLFSISEFKDKDGFLSKKIYLHYVRYYGPDAELSNYHAIRRKQEMKLKGLKPKSIPISSLEIYKDYKTKPEIIEKEISSEKLW